MPIDILVACKDQSSQTVNNVLVRVYTGAGALHTSGSTGTGANNAGEIILSVPTTGDYTMRLSMDESGYSVTSPQSFSVVAGGTTENTFDVSITLFIAPSATDATLCRCSGYFKDLTGAALGDVDITLVSLSKPLILGTAAVADERKSITTDASGYAQIDLIRGAEYRVEIEGFIDLTLPITIPNAVSANLPDVIFPFVTGVTFDPVTLTVAAKATATSTAVVDYRSGLALALDKFTGELPVTFASSDTEIATVSVDGASVKVEGVVAGAVTITVERALDDSDTATTIFPDPGAVTGQIAVTVT
jgi:uncharacterized protein YjdB